MGTSAGLNPAAAHFHVAVVYNRAIHLHFPSQAQPNLILIFSSLFHFHIYRSRQTLK
jgi:hypothetical protein